MNGQLCGWVELGRGTDYAYLIFTIITWVKKLFANRPGSVSVACTKTGSVQEVYRKGGRGLEVTTH